MSKERSVMAKKIMVVDDDPVVVKYLVNLFQDNGYETCAAEDGTVAFDMLENEKPDLITLDLEMKKEWFNLHDVIRDVVNKIGIQVQIKDGSIETNFKADPAEIYADKVHITNLISNLLDNANKYTPNKPQIRVETQNVTTGVMISIEDNGIGISHEDLAHIFDRFYRASHAQAISNKGSGLWLAIVKRVVEMHGGSIEVESQLNTGSTFRVQLPVNGML